MERQELDGKDDLDALLEEFSPNDLDSALVMIADEYASILQFILKWNRMPLLHDKNQLTRTRKVLTFVFHLLK